MLLFSLFSPSQMKPLSDAHLVSGGLENGGGGEPHGEAVLI